MSIEAVSYVLGHCTATGAAWQVLVVLAETADRHGRNAYPSRQLIAVRTNLTEKSVQRAFASLQRDGWIKEDGRSSRGTQKWRLVMEGHQMKTTREGSPAVSTPGTHSPPREHSVPKGGTQSPEGGTGCPEPGDTQSPKPSITLLESKREASSRASARGATPSQQYAEQIYSQLLGALEPLPAKDRGKEPTVAAIVGWLRKSHVPVPLALKAAEKARRKIAEDQRADNAVGLWISIAEDDTAVAA